MNIPSRTAHIFLALSATTLISCQSAPQKPETAATSTGVCSCCDCKTRDSWQTDPMTSIMLSWAVNHNETASINSLTSSLMTMRSQIQLYKLQHDDAIPDLTKDWTPMTETTMYKGNTYGPYIQHALINDLNSLSTVVDGTRTSKLASPTGFVYDYNQGKGTGRIFGTDAGGVAILDY